MRIVFTYTATKGDSVQQAGTMGKLAELIGAKAYDLKNRAKTAGNNWPIVVGEWVISRESGYQEPMPINPDQNPLRKWARESGIPIKDIAELWGVDQSYVSQFRSGKKNLSAELYRTACQASRLYEFSE